MDDRPHNDQHDPEGAGYTVFLFKRLILALIVIATVLYGIAAAIDYSKHSELIREIVQTDQPDAVVAETMMPAVIPPNASVAGRESQEVKAPAEGSAVRTPPAPDSTPATKNADAPAAGDTPDRHGQAPASPASEPQPHAVPSASRPHAGGDSTGTSKEAAPHATAPPVAFRPAGVAFVESVIKPIDYELNHRFWGWRPNDIVNVTDNINYFQLGILEVTRRTVVQLAERISRTGYNDAFDRNLENAMNWFMIKASSYWFPAPETKYKEGLAELERYRTNLLNREAFFYTRTDNLIPLLAAYEDLLGSCDQNLVKNNEADGSTVGFTRADNYFYYAKGVSSAIATILEAVSVDFAPILSNRNGAELLHHAILSCRLAASLEPWLITNGDLDGILANHRAHMAAPISHARFYLGQVIKTIST